MPNNTPNFNYNLPLVNNATDADLWGGFLNTNWSDIDTDIASTTSVENLDFAVLASNFNVTFLIDASSNTVAATLPTAASVFNGFVVRFKATDVSNTVTIDGNGAETIDGAASITIDVADGFVEIVCDGTNWQIIGDSTAFASQAEVETGTESAKAIAPDALRGALGFSKRFESTQQSISAGGLITVAHGLAGRPEKVEVRLVCTTANNGYSIGDEVIYGGSEGVISGSSSFGTSVYFNNDTDVNVKIGSSGIAVVNASTGTINSITLSSWRIVIVAWG